MSLGATGAGPYGEVQFYPKRMGPPTINPPLPGLVHFSPLTSKGQQSPVPCTPLTSMGFGV